MSQISPSRSHPCQDKAVLRTFLVVDDHPVFRHGVIDLLRAAWPQASFCEAGSRSEALPLLGSRTWDIVLLDLALGDGHGSSLLEHRVDSPVLVLTLHTDPLVVDLVRTKGARGLVAKSELPERILEAVRMVASGGEVWPAGKGSSASPHIQLSQREREILGLLLRGKGPKEIAQQLGITHSSVQSYKGRLFHKLGVENLPDLMRVARLEDLE